MPALTSRRQRGRWWLIGTTIAAAAAFMVVFVAASGAILTGSTFEGNDGNLVVNGGAGATDWANVAGLNSGIDLPSGSTDNAFGQGTKEDNAQTTVVTGSVPPNKNDLTRFYEASELASNNHVYLYLAWERLVNIGNANLDFEINQSATAGFTSTTTGPVTLNRTAGDLLVTYDFGGSGTPTLGLNTWLTAGAGNTTSQCFASNSLPCWGKHIVLGGSAEGAVNTVTVTDPIAPNAPRSLTAGLFGEAAIDLTAAGVFTPGVCEAFGSTFVKSRSSSSFTAEIKDFIAPVAVNISNCGGITIHKVTENGDGSFGYTTTGGLDPSTFSLSNAGQRAYSGLTSGSYSVTENLTGAQTTAGWTLKSLTCTATGSGTSASTSGSTANITLAVGGNVDCIYTNHINKSPSIATVLSAVTGAIGATVHDTSNLTGATANAGGTVTYTVYSDSACSLGARDAGTKTVTNGAVPNSDGLVFNSAGTFYWQAVYSGDANNNGATSPCTDEQLVIGKNQPVVSTAQHLIPNDDFIMTGATSGAGGTITFNLYAPSDTTCSGQPALTQTVNVSGNGTYSTTNTTFVASTEGTWRWQSSYSGDANNLSATSSCGTERFTIANS
jgi:hypothetical protein